MRVHKLIFVVLAVFVLSGFSIFPVVKRFEYRVELTVDGASYSGASVWEMRTEEPINPFGNARRLTHDVKGEAIAFELGSDVALFVAKRHAQGSNPDFGAFLTDCGAGDLAALQAFVGGCDLPNRPVLILAKGSLHGRDVPELSLLSPRDMQTMQIHVSKRAVAVTEAPITTGLIDRYPWIAVMDDGKFPGANSPDAVMIDSRKLYKFDLISE